MTAAGREMHGRREFVRDWHAWIRLERPTEAYENGYRRAPGHDTECEIDHIVSWVAAAGRGFLGGAPFDHAAQAESLVGEIDELMQRINTGHLETGQRTRYAGYLDASRRLLTVLAECASAPASPDPDFRNDDGSRPQSKSIHLNTTRADR